MTGMLTVLAPPEDVAALLVTMPGAMPGLGGGVLALSFGDQRGLGVDDASPHPGTDVRIADYFDELELEVYDFLAARTGWDMFLVDDGADLVDWRGPRPYGPDGLSISGNARRTA